MKKLGRCAVYCFSCQSVIIQNKQKNHFFIFVFILVTNLMHKICFIISLFNASTCFEHHVLIVRRSKLYYTASGIITPVGGRPAHGTATYTV